MTIKQIKNLSYRPQDLVYDPLFVVSGARDHYKAGVIAKLSLAKYQVCPIFQNMFSDLPTYPRKQLVMRKPREIPSYKEQKENSDRYFQQIHNKPLPVQGAERPKYFSFPIVTYPSEVIPYLHFPVFSLKKLPKKFEGRDKAGKGRMNENVQTQFRDTEMQTSPWQPDYKLISRDGNVTPQILKLDFLKWGAGLPAGKNEVVLIERARMKRAWEKFLPPPTNEAMMKQRKNIIEAMERDEWAFREQEIHEIQELRMQLLEEMLAEIHSKAQERSSIKLRNISDIKKMQTDAKIQKLRRRTERELRKLELKHRGVKTKYHETDVVEEHAHASSELYAPLMRHGEHPMRWHQVMDERLKYYKAQFIGVENFCTLPRWINKATVLKDDYNTTKLPGTRICMRETKWTTPILKKLHEELKNLHKTTKRKCTLRVRIDRDVSEISTPETDELPDDEEEKYQALVTLQSIIRGRATQMKIYEGRNSCHELIKELKYGTGLLEEQKEKIRRTRKKIRRQERKAALQSTRVDKLHKYLDELGGCVVGSLLDFLNKELVRLLDERRAHAICFLNERERCDREAAEAGRRQQELRRRREHDEIFKQMVKVEQDTVDLYLEDIITEGMNFASNEEAHSYIEKLAEKIEEDNMAEIEKTIVVTEQEEMISELVYHFVLPEVQKQMVREKIKKQNHNKLKKINDSLFDELIDEIPTTEDTGPKKLPSTGFKYEYQTEREMIEKLWKDDESSTLVSGTVSSTSTEESLEVSTFKARSSIAPKVIRSEIEQLVESLLPFQTAFDESSTSEDVQSSKDEISYAEEEEIHGLPIVEDVVATLEAIEATRIENEIEATETGSMRDAEEDTVSGDRVEIIEVVVEEAADQIVDGSGDKLQTQGDEAENKPEET